MDIGGMGVAVTDKTKFKVGDYLVYTDPTNGRLIADLVFELASNVNSEIVTLSHGTDDGLCIFFKSQLAYYEAKIIDPKDLVGLFNTLSLELKGREQTTKRVRDALGVTSS